MNKKDVEVFVRGYTSAKFDITKLEAHKPEELRAVIKFEELKTLWTLSSLLGCRVQPRML